jgi:thiamine pyrophosphokinase
MSKYEKHSLNNFDTIIIVGPMPFPWSALKLYQESGRIKLIFLDGGVVHKNKFMEKVPNLIKNSLTIGDGDSTNLKMDIKKDTQNNSDLAFILSLIGNKNKPQNILLLGFIGGRLDHALANLGEIAEFLNKFSKHPPMIQLDKKITFLTKGLHKILVSGSFSLITFVPNQIKITGQCQYPVKKWLKLGVLSSRGLSNVGAGEVIVQNKKVVIYIKN